MYKRQADELAFYDALTKPQAIKDFYEHDELKMCIRDRKRVVEIISTIQKKIVNNQELTDNLQQQAQAIYSSMFIDHPDPAWSHGHLSDLITVKYGKDHKLSLIHI